jgi:hypothetical protein
LFACWRVAFTRVTRAWPDVWLHAASVTLHVRIPCRRPCIVASATPLLRCPCTVSCTASLTLNLRSWTLYWDTVLGLLLFLRRCMRLAMSSSEILQVARQAVQNQGHGDGRHWPHTCCRLSSKRCWIMHKKRATIPFCLLASFCHMQSPGMFVFKQRCQQQSDRPGRSSASHLTVSAFAVVLVSLRASTAACFSFAAARLAFLFGLVAARLLA